MGWVLIVVILVWPPVHLVLQRTAGISPWKLFGLGMFSTPGGMDGLMHLGVIVIDGDPRRIDAARMALADVMAREWSMHRTKTGGPPAENHRPWISRWSTELVSQLCDDPAATRRWLRR